MNVSSYLAQDIVEDMKQIINQDINYFDHNGVIIASTDKDRIGKFHGGAKKSLEIKDNLIISYDGEYVGTRAGINLPVYFEKEIVGVIGVTGKREEVEKYGKIIQRMTEILIKEAYLKEQDNLEREAKRQFIEELLFRYYSDDRTLLTRAEFLNINTNILRVVSIARIMEDGDEEISLTQNRNDRIFTSFKELLDNSSQNLIVQSGMNIIVIHELKIKENIDTIIRDIKGYIESKYNVKLYFGIGEKSNNLKEIKKSYKEAKKSLDIALAFRDKDILYYDDLDIGLLIDDIPIDTINKYTNKIFLNMTNKEINDYTILIDSYIRHNGSITKAAEELFLHKNTLQYRLNKLYNLTGFNPRNISDMVVLYLAFTLFRLDFGK